MITPEMFTIFASMKCHHVGPDSLTSGFFGNPFLCGACYKEATNALNLQAQFIHGGETAASDADAQELLKVIVNPPLEEESTDNLKRMEIVASALLPKVHRFLSQIREHITRFDN